MAGTVCGEAESFAFSMPRFETLANLLTRSIRGGSRWLKNYMIDLTTLAYCAGVIDSDGTIGIKRSTYSMRKRGDASVPIYSERICVKQVTPEAVSLLKSTFGGSYYVAKAQRPNGRALYTWQITDKKAVAALRSVVVFLRIKTKQATCCLGLRLLKDESRGQRTAVGRGHKGGARRSATISKAMENLYLEAKRLNRTGRRENHA